MDVLMSYAYFGQHQLADLMPKVFGPDRSSWPRVFGDSGAFTVASQGRELAVDEYAVWLQQNRQLLHVYANLDVIGNARQSATNLRRLEKHGLTPLPVFHAGTDMRVLDRLADRYPYIAIGGVVRTDIAAMRKGWLARCFKVCEGRAQLHGFGISAWEEVVAFPWHSVDSTSWAAGHRYGFVPVWTGRRFVRAKVGDAKSVYRLAGELRQLGVDPKLLADRTLYHHRHAIKAAALSWLAFERALQRTRDISLYLVDGSTTNLQEAWTALREAT